MTTKHKALVTAPFRGEGLDTLRGIAEVVIDPWIDHQPIRLLNGEQLAEMVTAEGADLLIVESDSVKGPVLDLPLLAIGSCRGDPNNVDIATATAKGIPVLRAPGRNADAVAEISVALLFAVNRGVVPADADVREGQVYRDGTIPYQRYLELEAIVAQTKTMEGTEIQPLIDDCQKKNPSTPSSPTTATK